MFAVSLNLDLETLKKGEKKKASKKKVTVKAKDSQQSPTAEAGKETS